MKYSNYAKFNKDDLIRLLMSRDGRLEANKKKVVTVCTDCPGLHGVTDGRGRQYQPSVSKDYRLIMHLDIKMIPTESDNLMNLEFIEREGKRLFTWAWGNLPYGIWKVFLGEVMKRGLNSR